VPKISRFRAGCAATPEALLLSFIPVTLDLYRTVHRHLHWTLQNLVAFADRAGRCFPSVRVLAAATGQPRSTVSRHLTQNWPQRASSRVSGALVASMPTRLRAASCRRGEGCPTREKRVSHRREEKNRQERKPKALTPDSLNQG
jgi:Helix-turn-helix domain